MEQWKKMNQYEAAQSGGRDSPGGHGGRRETQKLGVLLQRRDDDSSDDDKPQAALYPKIGGRILTDEEEEQLFFRRRSAMSSMMGENFRRSGSAVNWEAGTAGGGAGKRTEQQRLMSMHAASNLLPAPRWNGDHLLKSSGHTMLPINAAGGGSRLPSGLLYPCPNPDGNPNSCLLNAAHFTFDSTILAPDVANSLTERIFKKLMGQSRPHESKSPNSTLDCPPSPTSSERSLRGKSLRCRSEDANTVANPRPKSQLAQYLRSMTAMSEDPTPDDLEGPSEAAWLDPDSPYRQEVASKKKTKPALESWSSNSSSWNLSLMQKPLKTVSTIVGRRHKGSRLGKDAIGSYNGSSIARSRAVRKGTGSEAGSGRSWWSEIGSGRKSSSMWACSGQLQPEPEQESAKVKADEAAFPFNNPVASSFVFRETEKSPDAASQRGRITTQHRSTVSVTDSEDLPFSDTYHDPEDGSITDCSDASLDREAPNGAWDSTRSLDYVVGLSSRAISSRALSGFLDIGRSGRFSVDLNRGQKLDKAQRLPSPDVRLRFFASQKSSRRSILSPCLPFLQKSPRKNVARIKQASPAGSSRMIQAVNSFAARLGPVSESQTLSGQLH